MARKPKKAKGEPEECPIVALGASAGGIPALTAFFEAVPQDPGVAFVVVLHLSPSHESHLVSVLQRVTPLDVVQVGASVETKANCIYVISPDTVLTISDNQLRSRKPKTSMEQRHPVDAIFQSLAEHRGKRAVCIVLSGTGSNGSAGAQAVRENEGVVLVQDPSTAEHPEMARNIIQAGLADRVLAPKDMPRLVLGYIGSAYTKLEKADEDVAQTADADLEAILSVVRARGDHDFSAYKKKTLVRRIMRRMGLNQIDSFRHYAEKLRHDAEEVQALIGDLLINVTGFFRDPEAWETFREKAILPTVEERTDGQAIRAWVPACSSGEEAYTVAMLLLEQSEKAEKHIEVKVFATDAAPQALARARAGVFPATIAESIPAERLQRFFDKDEELYRAKKALRDSVVFAPQNMLADPPFSRIDLITCRNLLIYIEPQVQEKLIALLHFSLRDGGYLFLGPSETIGRHQDLFQPISKKWRIFRRVGATRHELIDFPLFGMDRPPQQENATEIHRKPAEEARNALVRAFAPPAVLIDERGHVLYYHGDLGNYLKMPAGEPTTDLLATTRDELRPKLRAAIRQAQKEKVRVSGEANLKTAEKPVVRLTVAPVTVRGAGSCYLVSFEEQTKEAQSESTREIDPHAMSEGKLDEELRTLRDELRFSIEQLETSNEELKASNEEITSMNEELQSTNEELETSKEELQSLNEELNTVNTQLQGKVEELEGRTNDLNNLLNSTDIATLFLEGNFRIRWFSPPVRSLFQILPSDVGRPIADFAQRFHDDDFLDDAREVVRTLQAHEREVQGNGRTYLRRLSPYRTEDNRIDGVVATFTDITERKRAGDAVNEARIYAEAIVETIRQPVLVLDGGLRVVSANPAFYRLFQVSEADTERRLIYELGNRQWDIPELRRLLEETLSRDQQFNDVEVEHDFRHIGRRCMLLNGRKLKREGGRDELILIAVEDVTEREAASALRELLLAELQHRVKNLLTKVSSIVGLSQKRDGSVAEYAADLKKRIIAMSRTEDLIGGRTEGVGLKELVESETAGINSEAPITIEGPEVQLTSGAAQSLSLALHELATNAVKYGALATSGAKLAVSWSIEEGENGRTLTFRWRETGIAVGGKPKAGFGSRLIREVVPQMLGGAGSLQIGKDGVSCTMTMPLEKVGNAG